MAIAAEFLMFIQMDYSTKAPELDAECLFEILWNLQIPWKIRCRLVLILPQYYSNTGYHNIFHAIDVAKSTQVFLDKKGIADGYLLASTIAALFHDINRPRNFKYDWGHKITDFDCVNEAVSFVESELRHPIYSSIKGIP